MRVKRKEPTYEAIQWNICVVNSRNAEEVAEELRYYFPELTYSEAYDMTLFFFSEKIPGGNHWFRVPQGHWIVVNEVTREVEVFSDEDFQKRFICEY